MRGAAIQAGLVLALLALAALPGAQAADVTLGFAARQDQCPGGTAMCYVLYKGNLSDVAPGDNLTIHFANAGTAEHDFAAALPERADPAHRATSLDGTLLDIEDVPPHTRSDDNFTVPLRAKGVYFFCGEPGHEAAGMWFALNLTAASAAASSLRPAPLPPALAAGAAGLAAALAARRRR